MISARAKQQNARELNRPRYEQRLKPLRWLLDELNTNYSVTAYLMTDAPAPFVAVSMPGTYGCRVRLARVGGRCVYVWGEPPATHHAADPAGAARRLVVALRRDRRDRAVA